MLVRPYTEADLEVFKKVHADSGLNYKFPALESPLFITKVVVERAGRPTTLMAGRLEVETYVMTSGNAKERLEDMAAAQDVFLRSLWEQGIDNVYAAIPKPVERHFGKHMERHGWEPGRDGWRPWFRDTMPNSNVLA